MHLVLVDRPPPRGRPPSRRECLLEDRARGGDDPARLLGHGGLYHPRPVEGQPHALIAATGDTIVAAVTGYDLLAATRQVV